MFHPPLLDELNDPARVEINTEADATAKLAEMFDGQSESAGT